MPKRPKSPPPPALPTQPAGTAWRFEILGPPRTKKTSQRIVDNPKTGKPFIIGSVSSRGWEAGAVDRLRSQWHRTGALDQPVAVRALVYRDRAVGDWCGFMQAIGDALEHSGIIMNDRLIEHFDGSRRLKDADNPRVEITLVTL